MQRKMKKCYVNLERLSEPKIKRRLVKVDMKYKISSQDTLKIDEIKTKNLDNFNETNSEENVSNFLKS